MSVYDTTYEHAISFMPIDNKNTNDSFLRKGKKCIIFYYISWLPIISVGASRCIIFYYISVDGSRYCWWFVAKAQPHVNGQGRRSNRYHIICPCKVTAYAIASMQICSLLSITMLQVWMAIMRYQMCRSVPTHSKNLNLAFSIFHTNGGE